MFVFKKNAFAFYLFVTFTFAISQSWQYHQHRPRDRSKGMKANVTAEEALIKNLTDPNKYFKEQRPSELINVTFLLSLVQIDEVDEKKEHIITLIEIKETWFDTRLRWDPREYADLESIKIKANRLWTTDLFVYNSADNRNNFIYIDAKTYANVNSSGGVSIDIPPQLINTICTLDLTKFPFDEQTCQLTFSSWSFSADQVSFMQREASREYYQNDSIWTLESFEPGEYNETDANAFDYKLRLSRKRTYFVWNGILPLVISDYLIFVAIVFYPVNFVFGNKIKT